MRRMSRFYFALWFFLTGLFGALDVVFAHDETQKASDERYRWHIQVAMQSAHQCPDFRYSPVKKSKLNAWNDNRDDASTRFSFVSLRRDINDSSNIELSYTSDGSRGKIYGKQSFFRLRRDLEIDLKSLKLQYARTFWQPGGFSFGATASIQGLLLSMNADLPFQGYQHVAYLVAVPTVGAYTGYRTQGLMSYMVSSEFTTLHIGDIDGELVGFRAVAECRLTERFVLGAGYRFSDRDVRVNEKKYSVTGSHEVHGYQVYAGFDF